MMMLQLSPDTWTQGDWWNAILEPYYALLGEALVGTILAGALIVGFWIYSGDVVLPSILVLLLGGILVTVLPGEVVGIARVMIVIGMTAALLAAARRYVL
jgi:hypothetical protein